MQLWLRDPYAILAANAERGLVVDGPVIVECVAAGREPSVACDVFDASRHVVVPGLINTHHHFYQTLTRSLKPALDAEVFPWLGVMYPVWRHLREADLRLAIRVALSELVLSGCTTTSDHHYIFPSGLEDAIDITIEEAARIGLRVVLTRGSMDLSVEDGGLPPAAVVQPIDTILADSERLVKAHHDPRDGAMAQIALAPCSPFSVSRELMQASAHLAARHGLRLHTHLAAHVGEVDYCLERFGCRPIDYMEQVGWLGANTWLAHGIFFSAQEMQRLAAAGRFDLPLPDLQYDHRLGVLPGAAPRSGGGKSRPRRRRFLGQRFFQHDRRDATGLPVAARRPWRATCRGRRCSALGDDGRCGVSWPHGHRHPRTGHAGRSCDVPHRRAGLQRRRRRAGRP